MRWKKVHINISKVKTSNFRNEGTTWEGLRIWIKINSWWFFLLFFLFSMMINLFRQSLLELKKQALINGPMDQKKLSRIYVLFHRKWIERRKGAVDFEFFFFFSFFRVTSKRSYQLKVSICKPMARNLHRTSTGIIYEKSLEIH